MQSTFCTLTMMVTKANQSRGIRWIGGISRGKGSGGSRKSGCGEGGVEGVGTVEGTHTNSSMHTPS
jgi:hypothetical protein